MNNLTQKVKSLTRPSSRDPKCAGPNMIANYFRHHYFQLLPQWMLLQKTSWYVELLLGIWQYDWFSYVWKGLHIYSRRSTRDSLLFWTWPWTSDLFWYSFYFFLIWIENFFFEKAITSFDKRTLKDLFLREIHWEKNGM